MADTDTRAAPAEQPRDESRSEARRDLNKTVAQRQKLLLAGIGGVALIAGSMFRCVPMGIPFAAMHTQCAIKFCVYVCANHGDGGPHSQQDLA